IRTKGICYFSSNTDMSYLYEQAGVQQKLNEAGYWYATASDEEIIALLSQNADLLHDWDDFYGDRMIRIVFIGQHLDKEAITRELDYCLAE
ncbi:MAG: cobalamin biosynthesis protein CobW, partial [Bacteroidales bacterium]|nr:cobalamin biosynthesis protein CobW [Bacteroidales bacterium]